MPEDYGSHRDYIDWVKDQAAARQRAVEEAVRAVFSGFIDKREVEVVVFDSMTAVELAQAIIAYPIVLKAVLASCNIAGRAIERDLGIRNLDTYSPNSLRTRPK